MQVQFNWDLGSISALVGLVAVVVTLAVFFTRLSLNGKIEELQAALRAGTQALDEANGRCAALATQLTKVTEIGSGPVILRTALERELLLAQKSIGCAASSILVPSPLMSPTEFCFLASGTAAGGSLVGLTVPLDRGIAGYVYKTGNTHVSGDASVDPNFFPAVDAVSGFNTASMICVPIRDGGTVIGVMQFLNRTAGGNFTKDEVALATRAASAASSDLSLFIQDARNFSLIPQGASLEETGLAVLFADISRSYTVTSTMPLEVTRYILDAYLTMVTEIVHEVGGSVDKYLGDGALCVFENPSAGRGERSAAEAALRMQAAFVELKSRWLIEGHPVGALNHRIALESGQAAHTLLGPPQFRQLSVIGDPVNIASYLLEASPRNVDCVTVGQRMAKAIAADFDLRPVPAARLGKAKGMIERAFELDGTTAGNLHPGPPPEAGTRVPRVEREP